MGFKSFTSYGSQVALSKKLEYLLVSVLENSTITFSQTSGTCYFLICSGGGGGAQNIRGAGNGGGVNLGSFIPRLNTAYSVVIGAGGLGATNPTQDTSLKIVGNDGSESSAFGITVSGGAGGGTGTFGPSGKCGALSTVSGGTGVNNNTKNFGGAGSGFDGNTYANGPIISSKTGVDGMYQFGGGGCDGGYSGGNYGGVGPNQIGSPPNSGGGGGSGSQSRGVLGTSGGSGIVLLAVLTSENKYVIS
jgi:hypothetical protein